MPIEIRELVIRAQVDPSTDGSDDCSNNNDPDNHRETAGTGHVSSQADLVRACVQEVLRVLDERKER